MNIKAIYAVKRHCKVTQEGIEDGLFHDEPARVGEQVAEENQHIEFPENSSADFYCHYFNNLKFRTQ